ncbi:MAG: folate-binding protein YgfZ [Thermoleophilaceae bacterium]|nr:folate-binding protein YgfZ [Thermoleophilaceae bacterium]
MIATTDQERVRAAVGALDRSERGKLLLEGSEAAEFLQGQVTNDVQALELGRGCYAALLSHKGKLRADLRVLRGPGWLWIDTEPVGLAPLARTLKMYSIGRDARSTDVSASRAILSLLGPASDDVLEVAPPATEHAWVDGDHGLYVRTPFGIDVICRSTDSEAVRAALGVEPVSEESAECLRIEAGRPRHGLDMDEDTIPQEAGLNQRAVSFTKGCYVGQETVARLHYKGRPNRHLRGLRLSAPVERGADVRLGERLVGTLGSSCTSPLYGPIGLALIRREAEPGDQVLVAGAGAEVVALPFGAAGS